jgi:hypothetical protein
MGWGGSGYFTEYGPGGGVVLDGHLLNMSSYRAFKEDWVATPQRRPDLVVDRSGARATMWVSWNGATQLAGWRILGGAQRSQLAELGVVARAGFETEITVEKAPPWLAVQGLDRGGAVIADAQAVHGEGRS